MPKTSMLTLNLSENIYKSLSQYARFVLEFEVTSCIEATSAGIQILIEYDIDDVASILQIFREVYEADIDSSASADIHTQNFTSHFSLNDPKMHKQMLYDLDGMNNHSMIAKVHFSEIIRSEKITSYQGLKNYIAKPFSFVYAFDSIDALFVFGSHVLGMDIFSSESDIEAKDIEVEGQDIIISNRIIKNRLNIKKTHRVSFKNCLIENNITLTSVDDISFIDCIIKGTIECYTGSSVYFAECNLLGLNIVNYDVANLYLNLCRIYSLRMHCCIVEKHMLFGNRISCISLAASKFPDNKFPIEQINTKSLSVRVLSRKIENLPDKHYIDFCLNSNPEYVASKDRVLLETIEVLLQNGDLQLDLSVHCNLLYKKAFYSNTGLKRLFVFLTGGFFKPMRWVVYAILLTVLFSLFYVTDFATFIDLAGQKVFGLPFDQAILFSVLHFFGVNTLPAIPDGLNTIISTSQTALNTVMVANFFVSLVKKSMI